MFEEYQIKINNFKSLSDYPTLVNDKSKKELKELKELTKSNVKELKLLQNKLYAESKQALLIVLQALDAGGKDGTIRKVFGPINPQGCRVTSFKAPTELELKHDYLWRIHKAVPKKGMISIFNRSHYEDVLVVRVHNWIDEAECLRRYEQIKDFERMLHHQGTTIIKFYLSISREEQKKRFQERLDIQEKNWKFSRKDLKERKLWDKYIHQFEEVFKHTSTNFAPWYVIPADNKPYRNYLISTIVKETMQKMNLKFPPPEDGLNKIIID